MGISEGRGPSRLRGQDSNFAAHTNKITRRCLYPSIIYPRAESQAPPTYSLTTRTDSLQIFQLASVTPIRNM